jgi:hypothetical protein
VKVSLYRSFEPRSNLCQAVQNIRPLGRRDALWLADRIRDDLIDALQRMPGTPQYAFAEWSVLLAPLHSRIAELILATIDGRVELDEVLVMIGAMGG